MNEELNKAMEQISDEHIAEAARHKNHRRRNWISGIAAALALTIGLSAVAQRILGPTKPLIQGGTHQSISAPGRPQSPGSLRLANLVAAPMYPTMVAFPKEDDYNNDYEKYNRDYQAWRNAWNKQYNQPAGYADSLDSFFKESIKEFLSGDENRAYSPLNVYLALAMLAETTDGSSRQQILSLLGVDSIEALRTQAGHVWNAHYCDDGQTTSLLANSLWLDEEYAFKDSAVQTLANDYFASVFHGDLGTEKTDDQLRAWINSQTGGLLQEQAESLEMDPATVFTLASTAYFSAGWESKFSESKTEDAIFHCADYDLNTPFMHKSMDFATYYWDKDFGAVQLRLSGDNSMWLILPDKGKTVEDILESGEYWALTQNPADWKKQKTLTVNLSLPKFDISSQTDLIEGMKKLGVTAVFDPADSDFSPMTDTPNLFVGAIDHAARVTVDEEGVTGAAYTVMSIYATGAPEPPAKEIDFTLDRPFLFMVTSQDQLPLFTGVVEQP